MQLLWVTRVKKDINDDTVSMSTMILKDPNADFDGDAMNGVLLIEDAAIEAYLILAPHMRLRSTNRAEIGTNITIPNQSLIVVNHWLQCTD